MPRKPGSPEDWLRFAKADLAISRVSATEDILLESLCFHAQQSVEKSLKAVLLAKGITCPRTHNLKMLVELLPPDIPAPEAVMESVVLTEYAIAARYPGEFEDITQDEYMEAVNLADAVLEWAKMILNS